MLGEIKNKFLHEHELVICLKSIVTQRHVFVVLFTISLP